MAQRGTAKKQGKILVNVQVNADDEIDVVPIDKSASHDVSEGEEEEEEEEDDGDEELSDNMDSDPDLVQTKDGRLMLTLKRTKCCAKCKKPLKSAAEIKAHKPKCPGMVDEVTDVILKERKAAKHANPSDEFHKYCNPNPENPCYCCGEDISTAHVGHIRCRFCPKTFKAYEYLDRHIRSVHSESDEFPCSFCNARCPSLEIHAEHVKTHSEGKPFSCVICGKEFTRRYHLDRHVKHSNCGSDPKLSLPCEVCGKEFTRVDNLREHLRSHMGQTGRKRDYQCPYCSKSFYGSSLLNIHIRTHTGEKPFPCDLCPKSFPSSGALRKHRRKHTGERPYRCDECSATFAARETLNRHRKTHTGVKPHECKECGKRFIQATQLRTHMFVHTGLDGYKCKECGKSFGRKSRLNEHIKFEHQGEQPLQCNECSKEFFRRDELVRHMTVHTDKKEFQCPTCENTYARKASLTLHMKTHSLEEPAECTVCKKTFIRMDCLLRHMKKKHVEFVSEMIVYTEKRKEEEVLAAKAATEETLSSGEATVEINGEVYQITSMEDTPKQPTFVLPDVDTLSLEPAGAGSVKVLEVVQLPVVDSTPGGAEICTGDPGSYELVPITEETEVMLDEQHQEISERSVPVDETGQASPERAAVRDKNRPAQMKKEGTEDSKVEGSVASVKGTKPKTKVESREKPELVPVPEKKSTVEQPQEKAPVVGSGMMRELAKYRTRPPIASVDAVVAAKQPKARAKEKETAQKAARTNKAPAKAEPTGATKEPPSEAVKRKRSREPKTPAGKKRRPDDDSIPIFLDDDMLAEKISELLVMLVGEEMMQEFGWPETPVEEVLCKVILRCGHRPTKGEDAGDHTTRMRENTKILFSVTMDDDDVKALLNNHTVDEVIMHVLKSK